MEFNSVFNHTSRVISKLGRPRDGPFAQSAERGAENAKVVISTLMDHETFLFYHLFSSFSGTPVAKDCGSGAHQAQNLEDNV